MRPAEAAHARNAGLQVLRAVAALAVVLFHAGAKLPANAGFDAFKQVVFFGFAGVDIFFVVSGYVVTWTAMRIQSGPDARSFVLRRLGRIYGGYWPVLAVCALLPIVGVSALHPGGQWLPSVLLVEPDMERNVLPVAYTLVYELWFYALLTMAMVCVKTTSGRRRLLIVSAALLILWQVALMWVDFTLWRSGQYPFSFLMSGLLLEFLAGALIYLFHDDLGPAARRFVGGVLLAVGVLALVEFWTLFGLTLVRAAIGGAIGAGALLLALSTPATRSPSDEKGWWHRLGDASYSLYLLHTLVLAAVATLAQTVAPVSIRMSVLVAAVGVVLSVFGARIWYRCVERPLYRGWCAWLETHGATRRHSGRVREPATVKPTATPPRTPASRSEG